MTGGVDYLLTAGEAWPVFEREMLRAEDRVVAGFRVFDPATKLRTKEAQAVGEDWFDLILHVLGKGVRFELILADFDPIIAADMHELTWSSMRKFAVLRELADPDAPLSVVAAMHPAEVGGVARTVLWPKVSQELHDLRDLLNERPLEERRRIFADLPGIRDLLRFDGEGKLQNGTLRPPRLNPVSHHQKLAVFDGKVLYIGGLDLNPRRYDTPVHHRSAEETWHDVQVLVRDEVAAKAAEAHLNAMLDTVAGVDDPPEEAGGLCTTIAAYRSNHLSMAPTVIRNSIGDNHYAEIARTERQFYFETQFFRDLRLADALAARGKEMPESEFLMVLPAAPEDVAFEHRRKLDSRYGEYMQAECVTRVMDAFGDRCFFAVPVQRRTAQPGQIDEDDRSTFGGAPLIYVHAKVSVFDRRSAIISSANLNARSLRWDTEAGILRKDPALANEILRRSMTHWLPETEIDHTKPLVPQVRAQAELDAVRQPDNREGYLLPYDVETARKFGINLPGVPEELV
ncbi:phospholipase D-like domain-containing protein [Palleronia sp.]|uniref:phospholipase D-like domain-containing protein n=1 Tax=Palleronia sp. TaxID=1940284 RepID=UPI0035C86506